MAASRFPFEPVDNSTTRFIRTVAGLVTALAFIGLSVALLFLQPATDFEPQLQSNDIAGLYVSVLDGILKFENEDAEIVQVSLGDDLLQGKIYKTDADATALFRASATELEVILFSNSTMIVGSEFDPEKITLVSGGLQINRHASSEEKMSVGLGGLRLQLAPSCFMQTRRSGDRYTVTVKRGEVSVAHADDTKVVRAGESAVLDDGEFRLTTGVYLEAPPVLQPGRGAVIRKYAEQPLNVDLLWGEVQNAKLYRVEVASDILFKRRIMMNTVSQSRLTLADVREGMYYWRVTASSDGADAGEPSEYSVFTVQAMATLGAEMVSAPELEISETSAQSNLISIRGQTEPGARVIIFLELAGAAISQAREIVVNPTGAFRAQVESPAKGEIRVVVQAYYRSEFMTTRSTSVFVDF